ncbi:acyl carrier protein [Aeromicrobium sp. SMF47]|uniref:acyl carrier protein n=1 Tax=Aeromicrobium yanjiei TaxID=2662028 RepID=UPI00129D890C|nr:phosphopantetheine-binding protein [Aeromicrobium yanjiei]MRJ77947.1 acyl carrier protein [Aeromicrobium yanjiei]
MPSSSAVQDQLTDILVGAVGCHARDVRPGAVLADLGTDSLTLVEVGEELGRRFDVYLSDDTIDSMVTVQDAIDAVVRHDGSQPPADAPRVPSSVATTPPRATRYET